MIAYLIHKQNTRFVANPDRFLDWGTNPFFGVGSWFVNGIGLEAGPKFTTFLFQASYKTNRKLHADF